VGRVNLTWQVLEKTKKNLSASPISLYNRCGIGNDDLSFSILVVEVVAPYMLWLHQVDISFGGEAGISYMLSHSVDSEHPHL
jgi:hypothetical protein